jgi:hypothetical protein
MDAWEYFEQLDVSELLETPRPLGTPLNRGESYLPTQEEIEEKLKSKLGVSQRPLTPFSAKKVKGKKLYEYARE